MKKVLLIKVSPKADKDSKSMTLAKVFLDEYKRLNPDSSVTLLDLYKEGLKPLDNDMIDGNADMRRYAQDFAGYDRYVIASPMWNLGSPAILKMYIDYITIKDITFKYTDTGFEGLLSDKPRKVLHIVSRGGSYQGDSMSGMEMGDKFLRAIMSFYGINDFETLALELADVLQGDALDKVMNDANQTAIKLAKGF